MADDLDIAKVLAALIAFIVNMVFCLLPIFMRKIFSSGRNMSIAKCLSSGILFGTSVLQLLAESEKSPSIDKDGPDTGYPIVHFMFLCGFASMLILEYLIISIQAPSGKVKAIAYDILPRMVVGGVTISVHKKIATNDNTSNYEFHGSPLNDIRSNDVNATNNNNKADKSEKRGIAAYIFFFIVVLESAITGLAIGTQPTTSRVWLILISAIINDWAECLSVSIYLLGDNATKIPKKIYIMFLILSAATVFGIAFGSYLNVIMSQSITVQVSSGFMAYTAGAFIFISTMELMSRELTTSYVTPDPVIESAQKQEEDMEMNLLVPVTEEVKKTTMSPSEVEQTRKEILIKLFAISGGMLIPSIVSFVMDYE